MLRTFSLSLTLGAREIFLFQGRRERSAIPNQRSRHFFFFFRPWPLIWYRWAFSRPSKKILWHPGYLSLRMRRSNKKSEQYLSIFQFCSPPIQQFPFFLSPFIRVIGAFTFASRHKRFPATFLTTTKWNASNLFFFHPVKKMGIIQHHLYFKPSFALLFLNWPQDPHYAHS